MLQKKNPWGSVITQYRLWRVQWDHSTSQNHVASWISGLKRGDEEQELDLMEYFKLKFVYGVMTCVIQMMHKMYFSLPPVM